MIEFVRTLEDEVALAAANEEEAGAHPGTFFAVVGFLVFVLVGLFSGRQIALVLMGLPRLGALIGLICGAVLGGLVLARTPGLRRRWVDRRRERHVLRRFERAGRVRLWLDRAGLNVSQDGVHTHLPASAFEGATQRKTQVVWRWSLPALELTIPKRVGDQVNQLGWVLADLKARGAAAAVSHGLETAASDRPSPGSRPDLTVQLTVDDLVALARATEGAPSADRRDRRRVAAGRGVVLGVVLAIPAARATLPELGAWALLPAVGVGVVVGALGWWGADGNSLGALRRQADARARHTLASGGEFRQMWLDASGVGWADAVVARHVDWAAVKVLETSERYFVVTPHGAADTVIPRRLGSAADQFIAAIHNRCGSVAPGHRAGGDRGPEAEPDPRTD